MKNYYFFKLLQFLTIYRTAIYMRNQNQMSVKNDLQKDSDLQDTFTLYLHGFTELKLSAENS